MELIPPMLAVAGTLPADDESYGYEMKWDGVRAVVYVAGGAVRVFSRNDRDVSATYPETAELAAVLGPVSAVLDGELVAFGSDGRASFGRLQRRMHVTDPALVTRLVGTTPVVYLIFDVLSLDGTTTTGLSYEERRELLARLELTGRHWQTPPHFVGGGARAMATSANIGAEGVVAKRLASRYQPGSRSRDWVKVKHVRTQEVVIGGWRPGQGKRDGALGSLLLGVPEADGLRYVGHVGTGFTAAILDDLSQRLAPLSRPDSPFATALPAVHARDAHWASPVLVGEVAFTDWTDEGILRHASWRGLRPDKAAGDVRPE